MHIHILLIPITPCEHPPRSIICDVFFCSHFLAVSTLFWLLLLGMHCMFKQLHPHQNTHSPHHSDGKPLEVFHGGNNGWPRADPQSLGGRRTLRILVPENVGTSPMEASTSTIPKHMLLRILKRKEINESKPQQKGQKTIFWRGFG